MQQCTRREMVLSGAGALASAVVMNGCVGSQEVPGEIGGTEVRIVDAHLHPRAAPASTVAHLDGAGISHALLLARDIDLAAQLRRAYPDRFIGFCVSTDVTQPGYEDILVRGVRDGAMVLISTES